MSLGYTGISHLAMSDRESALYTYACQNLNVPDNNPVEDGEIYVEFEPIASACKIVRTKRYPDGIPITRVKNIDLVQMLGDGTLKIKNCSNATLVDQRGVDRQALILFDHIALGIQRDGVFPPSVAYAQQVSRFRRVTPAAPTTNRAATRKVASHDAIPRIVCSQA